MKIIVAAFALAFAAFVTGMAERAEAWPGCIVDDNPFVGHC